MIQMNWHDIYSPPWGLIIELNLEIVSYRAEQIHKTIKKKNVGTMLSPEMLGFSFPQSFGTMLIPDRISLIDVRPPTVTGKGSLSPNILPIQCFFPFYLYSLWASIWFHSV